MILEFDLELLTDVCVSNNNHTLGDPETHDCIPGRTLWGAVASLAYSSGMDESEAFQLFHQGRVRFLNAVPVAKDQRAYPAPMAWQQPKLPGSGKESEYSNFALASIRKQHEDQQFKPVKGMWVTAAGQQVKVETTYSLRTAVDPSGKAREGLLYGLPAIQAGTRMWGALVGADADLEKLARMMFDRELRLGRSKNSELGLVRLSRRQKPIGQLAAGQGKADIVSFLCVSRCVFRHPETGVPTLLPSLRVLGLPDSWKFDEASSTIRSARVVHFNAKRQRPEVERIAVERGSVLTFTGPTPVDLAELAARLANGVGEYTGQGYGEVLVAPSWLTQPRIELRAEEKEYVKQQPAPEPKDELFLWADHQKRARQNRERLFTQAQANAAGLRAIPAAQWGTIRRMAREAAYRQADAKKLRQDIESFLGRGKRHISRQWKEAAGKLDQQMQDHQHELPTYLELLASACMRPAPTTKGGN